MSVTDTSKAAHQRNEAAGEGQRVRGDVVDFLRLHGRMTRSELAEALDSKLHIISARVGDFFDGALVDGFTVIKSGKKLCSVGGKKVEALEAKELDLESCISMVHALHRRVRVSNAKCQGLERAYKAVV